MKPNHLDLSFRLQQRAMPLIADLPIHDCTFYIHGHHGRAEATIHPCVIDPDGTRHLDQPMPGGMFVVSIEPYWSRSYAIDPVAARLVAAVRKEFRDRGFL